MSEQTVNNPKSEEVALRLMRLLQACPELSQRELAQHMGISLGGLAYLFQTFAANLASVWLRFTNGVPSSVAWTPR